MIVIHALDAPYDIPGLRIRRGDTMYHLLSDQPGPAGTAELLTFVRAIGLQDAWMQSPGTYREHFDIFGPWAEDALTAGAHLATGREVAAILSQKGAAMLSADIPVPAITSRQMRDVFSRLTNLSGGDPLPTLNLAGMRLAELSEHLLSGVACKHIIVLVGAGDTGTCGLIAARRLADMGAWVDALFWSPKASPVQDAEQFSELDKSGINPYARMDSSCFAEADLIIDAFLSLGIDGPPREDIAIAIREVNKTDTPVLALDLPSGLDPDEAGPYAPCIKATATLTLALPKRGLTLAQSQPFIGDLWLGDIGAAPRLFKRVGTRVGDIFADGSLVRLTRRPLAGELLLSDVWQWVVEG